MHEVTVRTTLAAVIVGGLLLVPALATAQQATVTGRLTEQSTGEPIAGARVMLVGTTRLVYTGDDGRYTLPNVPSGRIRIRAALLGFQSQVQELIIAAGQTATADFQLTRAAVTLDAIVVTATGERRKREVAHNIASIDAVEQVDEGAITSITDLLSSRASGVTVTQSSGTTGSSTRIRIRGANSLSLNNEPLIYVDGVRIDNTQNVLTPGVGVGGQTTSRLNDINPEEIENIEIIKGPSAATLYGTEAANGVILVTTRRGRSGAPRWNVWAEAGSVVDDNDYPTNFLNTTAGGNLCLNFQAAAGLCQQDGELLSFNPLEDGPTTPIRVGNREQFGANVSGGGDQFTYFFSGEFERELGTFGLPDTTATRLESERGSLPDNLKSPNLLERISLRGNFGADVAPNATFNASLGFVTSDVSLPQNDNNSLGMIPSAFLGGATPESGWGFFTPDQVFAINTRNDIDRFTGSLQSTWDPASWLATRAAVGIDFTSQFDNNFFPPGEVPSGTAIDGTRNSNRLQQWQWTADVGATATGLISNAITSRSSVGLQFFKNTSEATLTFGNRLAKGAESLAGAVITQATEATTENTTVGFFGEQQFSWNDRVFITGGLRVDDNNALGDQSDVIAYPRASFSWVVSEESFFPAGSFLNSVRLRFAWGQTGTQPTVNSATRFFQPIAVTIAGTDVVGITDSSLGNPDLEAERSEEFEFGFDSEFLNGRVGLDVTYYRKRTEDQIVSRVLAPSLGSSSMQFLNLAEVRNKGWEGVLNAQILRVNNIQWDVTFTGGSVDNDVLDLGEGVQPIIFGLGGDAQRHEAGFPAGAYFQRPIQSFADENGDGFIAIDEVVVADSAEFLGTPLPKRELSIQSSVTLWNRVRISGLLDHRGGHKLQNGTAFFRCAQFFNCESSNVPGVDLEQQAATAAFLATGTRAGFVENASFWKMRELSVTFFAPDSWARALGRAERVSVTFTGRNLFTWTDYRGVDPEVITNAGANFSTADFLTQPPVRYWTVRLNVGF